MRHDQEHGKRLGFRTGSARRGGVLLALCLLLASGVTACRPSPEVIVAGSTLIQGMVNDLSAGEWRVCNMAPAGTCPGHSDLRPSDIENLARSKVLLLHEWQEEMTNVRSAVSAAGLDEGRVKVIRVPGNWMAPPVHARAVEAVARALAEVDPSEGSIYLERAAQRSESVKASGQELKGRLERANVAEIKVLCNEKQAGFIEWASFDIVATFGRPENMSVAEVERLVRQARETGAALVIDNLQSGESQISKTLARDSASIQVVLSNFPGALEDTETWEKAVEKNVDLLLNAVNQWRETHG